MIYQRCRAKLLSARGLIEKSPFLIRNIHFLIRNWHFAVSKWAYVGPITFPTLPFFLSGDTPMTRRNLVAAAAIIASVVLTACSDMTAPKADAPCPVVNGSSTCAGK
jgi:hypothetical protein